MSHLSHKSKFTWHCFKQFKTEIKKLGKAHTQDDRTATKVMSFGCSPFALIFSSIINTWFPLPFKAGEEITGSNQLANHRIKYLWSISQTPSTRSLWSHSTPHSLPCTCYPAYNTTPTSTNVQEERILTKVDSFCINKPRFTRMCTIIFSKNT